MRGPLNNEDRRRLFDIELLDPRLPVRFWAKIYVVQYTGVEGQCWEWRAARNRGGYGQTNRRSQPREAHRRSWEALVGPVPDGYQLDHLCRNRACVRPAHLEPVTRRENVRRGISPPALNARKTHCKQGHRLSGANLSITSSGNRECKMCRRKWNRRNMRRYRARKLIEDRRRRRRAMVTRGANPRSSSESDGQDACSKRPKLVQAPVVRIGVFDWSGERMSVRIELCRRIREKRHSDR